MSAVHPLGRGLAVTQTSRRASRPVRTTEVWNLACSGRRMRPDRDVRTLRTRRSLPLSRWCNSRVHTASRYVLVGGHARGGAERRG
jgi:hypothetical protein